MSLLLTQIIIFVTNLSTWQFAINLHIEFISDRIMLEFVSTIDINQSVINSHAENK